VTLALSERRQFGRKILLVEISKQKMPTSQ